MILHGDCLDILPTLDTMVDAVVTDPPYGLSFMGKAWDHGVPGIPFWEAIRDTMKPGAYLLAFGGDRTMHRMMVAIEDAGFEIRTQIAWMFGSGFPKSRNVSTDLDAMLPVESRCSCAHDSTQTTLDSPSGYRDRRHFGGVQLPEAPDTVLDAAPSPAGVPARTHADPHGGVQEASPASTSPDADSDRPSIGYSPLQAEGQGNSESGGSTPTGKSLSTLPASESGSRKTALRKSDTSRSGVGLASSSSSTPRSGYEHLPHCSTCGGVLIPQGLGTALKPAMELICVARKPLSEKTVAANVLEYGTGAINVDGCRIGLNGEQAVVRSGERDLVTTHEGYTRPNKSMYTHKPKERSGPGNPAGRWPANVCLDDSAAAMLDAMSGNRASHNGKGSWSTGATGYEGGFDVGAPGPAYGDTGGASRYFYVAKASRSERNAGLDGMPERHAPKMAGGEFINPLVGSNNKTVMRQNHHPTVKPIALMRWLVRLVTPPGGIVLDPFMGSGSTGVACVAEGFRFIGIERESEYIEIAERRINHAMMQGRQTELEVPA